MKKILLLILLLLFSLTSCGTAIEDFIKNNTGLLPPSTDNNEQNDESEHTHEYTSVVTSPTCISVGYTTYTCKSCGDSYVADEIPTLEHTEIVIDGKSPSCVTSGITDGKKCYNCNTITVEQDIIPALGHTEITVPGKEPTCTDSGLTDGKVCSACNAIIVTQNILAALGHGYNAVTTVPTCTSEGYTTYTCTDCFDTFTASIVPPLKHNEVIIPGKEPTCNDEGLSDGKICYTCSTVTVTQEALPSLGHNYNSIKIEATCETEGYTTHTCTTCGDVYTSDRVPANGHNEVIIPGKEATATSTGLTEGKKCSVCGTIIVYQTTIPALGHNYTVTVIAPTCVAEGYTTYFCSDCGDYYVADKVPALGHTEITVVGKAATCTTSGLTDGKKCSVCGTVTVAQTTISALGHTEITISGKAATCTTSGLTDGKKCSVCGTVTVAQTTISALGHTEVTVSGKAATCTTPGLTDGKKCSVCGTVTVTQTSISALGHTEITVAGKAATCTASGLTDGKICSVCGTVTVAQTTISALGHTEITVAGKAATCTTPGLTDGKKCSVCGTVIVTQVTITANGHNWTPATTTAPKTCLACGITEGDKLPENSSPAYSETLYVSYINVGQGDSILIKLGDCDILIDAGVANQGSTVSKYLKAQGVDDIELMINTHPDADHCGGLTTVLNDFVVEEVWASPLTKTTAAYKNFASAVSKEGLTMETPSVGTIYTYEYMTLTVLYNGAGTSDSNDSSIVVMLQYGSFRFLFTGDISSTIESKLVSNSNIDLSCDVLKVAHHGSKYSSNMEFLRATGAKYGVICVGDNSYGHPTSSTLNNLKNAGISVYRTDQNGNVVFSSNGATLTTPGGTTLAEGSASYDITDSTSQGSITFIGNKESKVFHLPTCGNLPDVSKRNYLYNYWFIVNCIGYRPCQVCLKNYTP